MTTIVCRAPLMRTPQAACLGYGSICILVLQSPRGGGGGKKGHRMRTEVAHPARGKGDGTWWQWWPPCGRRKRGHGQQSEEY